MFLLEGKICRLYYFTIAGNTNESRELEERLQRSEVPPASNPRSVQSRNNNASWYSLLLTKQPQGKGNTNSLMISFQTPHFIILTVIFQFSSFNRILAVDVVIKYVSMSLLPCLTIICMNSSQTVKFELNFNPCTLAA